MTITLLGLGIIKFATGFLPVYAIVGIAAPAAAVLFQDNHGNICKGRIQ